MIDWENPRLKWSLISAGVLCFLIALFLVHSFSGKFTANAPLEQSSGDEGIVQTIPQKMQSGENAPWVVYVTGSVKRPGVYEVPSDSRVHFAVEMAGGFSPMADPEGINLAEKLSDGAHIRVPAKGETAANVSGNASVSSGAVVPNGRVDINRATVAELQTLPGVGPKTAEAIISNRETMGRFIQVDDLMRVKGIGPKRMEQLRELVIVGR